MAHYFFDEKSVAAVGKEQNFIGISTSFAPATALSSFVLEHLAEEEAVAGRFLLQ